MSRKRKVYPKQHIAKLKKNVQNKLFIDLLDHLCKDQRTSEEISDTAIEMGMFVSAATIYCWREGKTKNPRISTMEVVAKVLGLCFRLEKSVGNVVPFRKVM